LGAFLNTFVNILKVHNLAVRVHSPKGGWDTDNPWPAKLTRIMLRVYSFFNAKSVTFIFQNILKEKFDESTVFNLNLVKPQFDQLFKNHHKLRFEVRSL
jgi:hypothetical protein